MGIDQQQIDFLDTFLLLCLFADSDPDSEQESHRLAENQLATVEHGRDTGVELTRPDGTKITLYHWADELLKACAPIAQLQDQTAQSERYGKSLVHQAEKLRDASLTPSGQILAAMQDREEPFYRFSMDRAIAIKASYNDRPLATETAQAFALESANSLKRQTQIEAEDSQDFETFLQGYLALPG